MLRIPNRIEPADVDEPIALFRTFARNPTMWAAMTTWGRYELGRDLSVDRRTRELVILRACARCRCAYEWGVHVGYFAEKAGVGEDVVASTWSGDEGDFAPADADVIGLVDELHDSGHVSDERWRRLAARFDDAQLLDLLLLAGWYHAISYAANGARVEPEPWAAVPPVG